MASPSTDLSYVVSQREIVAVEHPMIVKNIDDGLKTFGTAIPLKQLLNAEGYEGCLPLYLRPVDPTCAPTLSHNTATSNVLLKIIVPKKTGRKRKRGSQEPFPPEPPIEVETADSRANQTIQTPGLRSQSRLDNPRELLQILKDNVGNYQMEAVGIINQTHRYRGIADFHYSTHHGKFMTKVRETILTGNIDSIRKFKLDPSRGPTENEELIPPPTLSDKIIPINWGYHQNSNVKITTDATTGQKTLINRSSVPRIKTYYIPHDVDSVPASPPELPPPEPILQGLLTELHAALALRPVWTRRAILNRVSKDNPGIYLLKPAIQYVGYQFRGGPWRDAIVRYGVDPRQDPKYRLYQTLFFKIVDAHHPKRRPGMPWHDIRSEYTRRANAHNPDANSHIFDGKSISLDGKIWQVCDITDPLLVRLLGTETLREACDVHQDGWFCNGTWAKVRAIMRTKIAAIRAGRAVSEEDFKGALAVPDLVTERDRVTMVVPLLRELEWADRGEKKKRKKRWGTGGGRVGGVGGISSRAKRAAGTQKTASKSMSKGKGKDAMVAEAALPMDGIAITDPRVEEAMNHLEATGAFDDVIENQDETIMIEEDEDDIASEESDDDDDDVDEDDEAENEESDDGAAADENELEEDDISDIIDEEV